MCTVWLAQVIEISTPAMKRMPTSAAAVRALAMPPTSSWSVKPQTSTPARLAYCATAAGDNTPSDTFE